MCNAITVRAIFLRCSRIRGSQNRFPRLSVHAQGTVRKVPQKCVIKSCRQIREGISNSSAANCFSSLESLQQSH